MKILHLIQELNESDNTRICLYFINSIPDIKNILVTSDTGSLNGKLFGKKEIARYFLTSLRARSFRRHPRGFVTDFKSIISEIKPNWLIVYQKDIAPYIIKITKRSKIKMAVFFKHIEIQDGKLKLTGKLKKVLKSCDVPVFFSRQEKDHLLSELNLNFQRTCLIHSGVDFEQFKKVRVNKTGLKRELGIKRDEITVGLIYTQHSVKLIKQFIKKISDRHKCRFLLIKKDSQKITDPELTENIIANSEEEAFKFLNVCVLLVSFELSDSIPEIFLYSLLASTPVISLKFPGVDEILKNEINGFIIAGLYMDEFVIVANRFLSDKKLQKKMSSNASDSLSEKFDLRKSVQELVATVRDSMK